VSDVIPTIKNEKLKKIAIGYAGQEAQHSKEHKRACAVLEGQGYSLNRVTSVLNAIGFGLPSRFFGKKFAVALAGAFEHVTILVARNVLGKNLLEGSNHEMRQLFEWHVAEEVEHRNAVHDVMSEVCPGFIYRLLGILMAAGILFVQSYIGTFMLLYQDGKAFKISSQITYFKHYGLYYPSPYEMIVHYLYPNYSPDMYIDDSILQKVDSVLNHREAA
jgi:predicted metal-dependent hydrolase